MNYTVDHKAVKRVDVRESIDAKGNITRVAIVVVDHSAGPFSLKDEGAVADAVVAFLKQHDDIVRAEVITEAR